MFKYKKRKELMDQTWNASTFVPGAVTIEIQGLESFGSNQPLSLIDRACHVFVILTGKVICGNAGDFLEFVSGDPANATAVFRTKKAAYL